MQSLGIRGDLASVERQIPGLHLRIDEQRQLLETLAIEGQDLTSAAIVLDSLLISLFLCVENRHRVEPSAKVTHAA
jgi:hypothetical protein